MYYRITYIILVYIKEMLKGKIWETKLSWKNLRDLCKKNGRNKNWQNKKPTKQADINV